MACIQSIYRTPFETPKLDLHHPRQPGPITHAVSHHSPRVFLLFRGILQSSLIHSSAALKRSRVNRPALRHLTLLSDISASLFCLSSCRSVVPEYSSIVHTSTTTMRSILLAFVGTIPLVFAQTTTESAAATASSGTATSSQPVTHTIGVAQGGFTFVPNVVLAEVGDYIGM